MALNYANENIGKKCEACKVGVIFYYREVKKDVEIEVIGCTNELCKGHFEVKEI